MSNEARYYDALKCIARADSPEYLRDNSERKYGLLFEEAIEMAYDNLKAVAQGAIQGKRKAASPPPLTEATLRPLAESYNGHSGKYVCCCDRCKELLSLLQKVAGDSQGRRRGKRL
jgi:hypothetical protein